MKKVYGLLGEKLGHSYSKVIHEMLGYDYRLIEKKADEAAAFISEGEFDGLNVTIPYKKTAMDYCDDVSELANRIGAVNTIYFSKAPSSPLSGIASSSYSTQHRDKTADCSSSDRTASSDDLPQDRNTKDACERILCGTNTDYEGLRYTLERAGISLRGKRVLILGGSGGAGSMVKVLAADEGASEIVIASRNPSHKPGITFTDYDHLPLDADIIINATPVGTSPDIEKSPIDLSEFKNCSGVCDLIYNPLRTALLTQAEHLGINNTNGLPMLVRQAAAAAEYFYGNAACLDTTEYHSVDAARDNIKNSPRGNATNRNSSDLSRDPKKIQEEGKYLSRTEEILTRLEKQIENIVLIGMPGCGKSSIGKILARKTGRRLKDSDQRVREMFGQAPADIIKKEGEVSFRKKETLAIASLAKEHSIVIATGGGAVMNPRNVDLLRQNGRIVFIDRDPDKLSTFNRPLSQNGGVYRIYDERYPIYSSCCDHQIKNNGKNFSVCAAAILEFFK